MKHINKCSKCDTYSMKLVCPKCGEKTQLARPPKYSPVDKMGEYRRIAKLKEREEQGLM